MVTFPRNKEIDPILLVAIRQTLIAMGILSKQEFDSFVSQRLPLLGRVIKQDIEEGENTPLYVKVRDAALKQRLSKLGSPPMDTIIREAGVVLEDRLRQTASETDANLHGVALVDALLSPAKAKIIFSKNPAEQDGARMLYRGAIQFIRNPAMHKLIEYRESEARIFIGVIDSLLQLLSEAKLEPN